MIGPLFISKSIADLEKFQAYLGSLATSYHSKLTDQAKVDSVSKWTSGEKSIMLATSAFGVGVDFPKGPSCLYRWSLLQYGGLCPDVRSCWS